MDNSFTNVLEETRQYFQGLPSPASSSSQPPPLPAPDPPAAPPTSAPATATPMPQQSTSSSAPSNVLSYWPPPSTVCAYQRKEIPPTPLAQTHLGTSQVPHHQKLLTASSFSTAYNGSRLNPAETSQGGYTTAPQRPQGHNLPPIAALSNYHSSRSSRETLTTQKVQPHASSNTASTKTFHRAPQTEYTLPRQNQAQYVSATSGSSARLQYGHQGPNYQQIGVVPPVAAPPQQPLPATSYNSFPPTTLASSSMSSTSSSSSAPLVNPSLSSHPTQQYAYHALPEQPAKQPTSRQYPTQTPYFNTTTPTPTAVPKHNILVNGHQKPPASTPSRPPNQVRVKRESPLDLSVKTVRQSADSTADDSEGLFAGRNFSPAPGSSLKSRPGLPTLQLPSSVAYPTMDTRVAPRSATSNNNSNVANPASVGAPKIDFHANFAAHQHSSTPAAYGQDNHHRPKDRLPVHHQPFPQQQQSSSSSSSSLPPSLPHVSSFKSINQPGYDHKLQASASYNHAPSLASSYDPKQAQSTPLPYNHKLPAQQSTPYAQFTSYNHKQTQPTSANVKPPQQPVYNHKPVQSATLYNYKQSTNYDPNKQAQQASFDYKKVQPSVINPEHKQTLTSYDHSKQSQSGKYDPKQSMQPAMYDHKVQQEVYDHKQVQAKAFEHGKLTQPSSYDYKQQSTVAAAVDHKQALYYASASQQHRPTTKPPASVGQSYPNTHFTAPVPAGYDPGKRAPEMAPGYGGGRGEYRPVANSTAAYPTQGGHKRVMSETRQHQGTPAKVPRPDTWRQTMDQQIEQRFSSYTSARLQQPLNGNTESNGNSVSSQEAQYHQRQNHIPPQHHASSRSTAPQQQQQHPPYNQHPPPGSQYPHPQNQRAPNNQRMGLPVSKPSRPPVAGGGAADKRVLNILRNTLEEKEARMAQLQNQLQHNAQLQQHYHQRQPQSSETPVQSMHQHKPSVSPTLPPGRHNLPPYGAGLENSHAASQHKLHVPRAVDSVRLDHDPHSQRVPLANTQAMMADISRHNAPPTQHSAPPVADLEGFAAYLAARIRTKGELKQVGPSVEQLNTMQQQQFRCPTPSSSVVSASNSTIHSPRTTPTVFSPPPAPVMHPTDENGSAPTQGATTSSGGSPPKLTRERVVVPPRRRLFSRPDEETGGAPPIEGLPVGLLLPPRDLSGLRSSSETSVFDFRDSDSESEMPVLERQTLNEMRKDRKINPKLPTPQTTSPTMEDQPKEEEKQEPVDPFWSATCDNFVEQLRTGTNPDGSKRRGRRKKVGTLDDKKSIVPDIQVTHVKKEVKNEVKQEVKIEIKTPTNLDNSEIESKDKGVKNSKDIDLNEDVPLMKRRGRLKSDDDDVDDEISLAVIKARLGKTRDSASERLSSDSEASDEESKIKEETVAERVRTRKNRVEEEPAKSKMKLRSKDPASPRKTKTTPTKSNKVKKKPHFGDGSDFTPGWEEQVYRFKRSLRMPARLINIPRPRDAMRLSTSLPDLDPYPCSPATSTMDSSDIHPRRNAVASNLLLRWDAEGADSDFDSNSNLSFALESEEATSSSVLSNKLKDKMKDNKSSILNRLVLKYGRTKAERKKEAKNKWLNFEHSGARFIPRKTEPELMPTPSLGIGLQKPNPPKKGRPFKKKIVDIPKEDPFGEDRDGVYLGFFRKKTVNNYRDAFIHNGTSIGQSLAPIVLKSRTRTQTRVLRQRATMREVFGEDRPASAPPTCHETDEEGRINGNVSQGRGRNAALLRSNKAVLISKRHLLHGGRRRNQNLIRALASKTLMEMGHDVDPKDKEIKKLTLIEKKKMIKAAKREIKTKDVEKPLIKKRIKLRNVRRKFRSGFDYIRKKKKPLKRDVDGDIIVKEKKRNTFSRPSSESVQDIQNEIRGWVINKGLGETLLHRAARLGYTDVAAYCLEKLDNPASPRDNAGYTPLHEACSRGHMDIARLLLMYGANVSDSAIGGIRPLHEAAENGFTEMMRLLLSYGADPLLATYSGQTPLSMASDDDARRLLQLHLADVQGLPAQAWNFQDAASFCDHLESGFNVLQDPPCLSPEPLEDDDIEMELSEMTLPVLYRLRGDPPTDRWVLLQDLTALLRAKSKDSLLRQLGPEPRNLIKELKMADFLDQARCCHLLGSGERINVRASKVALIPYNEKVKEMLGVEKVSVSSR